jgi:hypothetical protein
MLSEETPNSIALHDSVLPLPSGPYSNLEARDKAQDRFQSIEVDCVGSRKEAMASGIVVHESGDGFLSHNRPTAVLDFIYQGVALPFAT